MAILSSAIAAAEFNNCWEFVFKGFVIGVSNWLHWPLVWIDRID